MQTSFDQAECEIRELTSEELDMVSGGNAILKELAKFAVSSVVGGALYDGVKYVVSNTPRINTADAYARQMVASGV